MGFPSFPETRLGRAWREMQHFTFHLHSVPGCHPQHLSTTQSERCVRPVADVPCASCHSESYQTIKKKGVVVTQVKPYTSSSLVLCFSSFHSVCSLLAGRSRFTLTPHTISLTLRLGEEHYMPKARASPNSSHSTAAVTTYNIADRRTEILSLDSHKLVYFIFSFSFFHQFCLSCFTPPFSPCPLSVYYWFLSVERHMSINRQI